MKTCQLPVIGCKSNKQVLIVLANEDKNKVVVNEELIFDQDKLDIHFKHKNNQKA